MKITLPILTIALALAGCASDHDAQLAARAKVTRVQAGATALHHVHGGTVSSSELEEEHGRLVWSFDIAHKGIRNISEVQVDAVTGKVVATEIETPEHEAAEKKGEAHH